MYGNDIPAVFVNTGLEYPEIQSFVKTFENVVILKPKMRFDEVIKKYGYPLISKDISQNIYEARKTPNGYKASRFDSNSEYNKKYGTQFDLSKWVPLLNLIEVPVSHMCCHVIKKSPSKTYEHTTGRKPFIGTMTEESRMRETEWLKNGCNSFDGKRPSSKPMSFWTEQDVLRYIKENGIPIASVYGDIVAVDDEKNQYAETLLDGMKLKTTGCQRTGCMFCAFGAHCRDDTRFLDLKRTHPKQYAYCVGGGEFVDGVWKPSKDGLGLGYVFDRLNEIYGQDFIRYK
jgi:3'-phosphoadenosine 5'-phosphosulfate sulfotransferase (PAPS reductase)/FAD synthetase